MYDLADSEVEEALVDAAHHGISVRVLLNKGYYGAPSPMNEAAYEYLESNSVPVKWTPASFALTHEKLLVADNNRALIMGFNLTPKYYPTSRDFGINDSDSKDTQAIEKVFDADWRNITIAAPEADDLVWSPHSENEFVSLLHSAKHSILIYNEEMSDGAVIQALEDAAERGVSVNIIMTYQSTWRSTFFKLVASGVHLRASSEKDSPYIHAKMIVIDGDETFVGSQNFSRTSLEDNRELGILVTKLDVIKELEQVFGKDW
jgi:phosphatidylserine/phosphatidylglycerophosphate/cardiolipin synthase-like enzyme